MGMPQQVKVHSHLQFYNGSDVGFFLIPIRSFHTVVVKIKKEWRQVSTQMDL